MNSKTFRSLLVQAFDISSHAACDNAGIVFLRDALNLRSTNEAHIIYMNYMMKNWGPTTYSADLYDLRKWAVQHKRVTHDIGKLSAKVYDKKAPLFIY